MNEQATAIITPINDLFKPFSDVSTTEDSADYFLGA
jgi:hypothetical protein